MSNCDLSSAHQQRCGSHDVSSRSLVKPGTRSSTVAKSVHRCKLTTCMHAVISRSSGSRRLPGCNPGQLVRGPLLVGSYPSLLLPVLSGFGCLPTSRPSAKLPRGGTMEAVSLSHVARVSLILILILILISGCVDFHDMYMLNPPSRLGGQSSSP